MTRPLQQWRVLPHGKLSQIDDDILTVVGEIHMPLMDLPRRMTVVRLSGSRLVVFSAIALDEDDMAALEAYGRPTYLIVPSDKHRLDAKIWKDRYPAMRVVAPEGSRVKIDVFLSYWGLRKCVPTHLRLEIAVLPGRDKGLSFRHYAKLSR